MNNLLELINPNNYKIDNNRYTFQNIPVPRVTEILSIVSEEYLITWANNLGLYQHKKHIDILETAANIGTAVHKAIEEYLLYNKKFDANDYDISIRENIANGFNSFLQWWNIITNYEYEIIFMEKQLVCKYFGGTLDMLIRIKDKLYIVDFKTSNQPNYKYFLQLAAYRYMLQEEGIEVDGCVILMLNKKKALFNELVLDFSFTEHLEFINNCQTAFFSYLYTYYNKYNILEQYNLLFN